MCKSPPYANLHTVNETGAFVVTAEDADWIHNFIHCMQRHAVHQLGVFAEILLDLVIKHIQNGLGGLICLTTSQLLNVSFHDGTSQLGFCWLGDFPGELHPAMKPDDECHPLSACLRRRMGLPDSLCHGSIYDGEIS